MWRASIAVLLFLVAESAALACSCPRPLDEADERAAAERIAEGAVALVEVDILSSYAGRGRGERMRVHRLLAGRTEPSFRLVRTGKPDSAMCDNIYEKGSRALVILYPADRPRRGRELLYREGGLCSTFLVRSLPHLRQALIEAIDRRKDEPAARPGKPPVRCP